MRWEDGRSGGGYRKLTIFDFTWPFRWDLHLIHTPRGAQVRPHRDPLQGKKHWRLNVVIKRPGRGGEFCCEEPPAVNLRRIKLFRPDIHLHWVTEVMEGSRLCLSLGWAFNE